MKTSILTSVICVLTAAISFAEVTGTVVNRTSGKPQPGAVVTLYSLGQTGMQQVQTVKSDGSGGFEIDHDLQGPHLVQTIHDGVVYNKMIPPGSGSSGLELDVYNSTTNPAGSGVGQHMVILEPMGGILHVNESFVIQNSGNATYNDSEKGAVRGYLPPDVQGSPRLMATAPQGMPVARDIVMTGDDGTYMIDYPVKPGETRFDLTYVLPQADPLLFASRVLHEGPVRIVAPLGVTISGDAITQIGEEPQTHAKIYDVTSKEYSVTIEGAGSLSAPEAASSGGGSSGGGGNIQQIQARIYDRVFLIVGLALLILMAGFALLYRRPAPTVEPPASEPQPKGKRH